MATATSSTTSSTLDLRAGTLRSLWRLRAAAGLLVAASLATTLRASPPSAIGTTRLERPPHLEPDYTDLVIPPNIAPLNFTIKEPGSSFYINVHGKAGTPLEISGRTPKLVIPEEPWHRLLGLNRGGEVLMDIYAQGDDRKWRRFLATTNQVANEAIDPFLLYRKIQTVHSLWGPMAIYQRNLQTYDESPILENRRFANDCCHCHALRNNNPDTFTVDIRSRHYQNSLLVISNGAVRKIEGTAGFVAWHPKGPVIAASFSKPRLLMHTARNAMLDVAEVEGWIGYFLLGSNVVRKVPGLADERRLIGLPEWAPDGRYLYYVSAPNPWTNMAKVRAYSYTTAKYDLMRIAYDLERDHWGQPEMVLPVSESGFSVAQPRISPDGRWLFFCAIAYGCWPTYDSKSDLYGIDLKAGNDLGLFRWRKLELNSDQCESWLSWSSNSRWVVFSSKRISPLFNRPFLAYVSPEGKCGKPFILPQRDPQYYDSLMRTYTKPTLAIGPVTVPQSKLIEAITSTGGASFAMPGGPPTQPSPEDHE